jgi:hypothetical protein
LITYSIEAAALIIRNTLPDQVVWQGKPYGCSVRKILPQPDQMGCIVLLDDYEFSKSEYRSFGNLIFLNSAGEIKWNAETPSSSDSYMDFKEERNKLFAHSWDGFYVEIDKTNGKIINKSS